MSDDFETRVREALRRRGAPDQVALERLAGYVAALPPRRSHRLRNLSLAASIVVLLGLVAVALPPVGGVGTKGSSPPDSGVAPSGAVSGSPAGTPPTDETRLTCGDPRTFPASGLDAPIGAEKASGPEFDALRAAFAMFAGPYPDAADWSWRLAGRDDSGAIFLAQTERSSDTGWVSIEVVADSTGWHPTGMGSCNLYVVLPSEFETATWTLDPAFPSPTPDSSELHVLVQERACSGGSPPTNRMSAPIIEYAPETVTVTLGVRPLGGIQTCIGIPATPALVHLTEPLGKRILLDGGPYPPAPPSSPRSVLPIDPSIVPISI